MELAGGGTFGTSGAGGVGAPAGGVGAEGTTVVGLMLDVATGEQRVERGSKAAKRLEGGLHEQELAGLVVVVAVLAELVKPMGLVMPVAKRVGGGKGVLAWFQMSASEVVLDNMHVCEVQKLVPVEDVLVWDVAT